MKKVVLILSAVLMTVMMVSFSDDLGSEKSSVVYTSLTFQEVAIGKQVWMSENLNVDKFRNGDSIPEVKTHEEWKKAGEDGIPAYCYYDNDPKNGEKYGKLYNWHAVNDPRGLAPNGWHVPSDEEWTTLTEHLGGQDVAGKKMKNTNGWAKGGNGNNKSDFSGLPGGTRWYDDGSFNGIGEVGRWWSSTESFPIYYAWFRDLGYTNGEINRNADYKENGVSVRCLKD